MSPSTERFAGLWFIALGAVSAVLVLAGVLSPLDLPVIDLANFIGYVLWSIWLVVFGLLLLLRRPRTGTAATRACALQRRRAMTTMEPSTSRRHALVSWLIWTAGFVSFPIAGVAAGLIVGRVDDPLAALVAGLVTGAVIGAGQWLASRGRLSPVRWIPATALGMGVGLLLGATAVGFGTTLADLAVMGALTGLVLGVAQTLALPSRTRYRWVWAVAVALLWALGWTVTTLVGVAVEEQFSVFGAAGAITFSALSGVLLNVLLPARASTTAVDVNPAGATVKDNA